MERRGAGVGGEMVSSEPASDQAEPQRLCVSRISPECWLLLRAMTTG